MRRSLSVIGLASAIASVTARGQVPPASQTFRSTTDTVLVDVSVRDRGTPVAGLTANDFVLLDNGVRQQVESVEASAVPIDLTLVIDESGSFQRTWDNPRDPIRSANAVDNEIKQIASVLRQGDRLQVLAIDQYVERPLTWTSATELPTIRYVSADGLASMNDALITALVQPVEPNRRHVVVVRTKGIDTISVTEPYAVRAVARKSDALLHLVMMERAADNDEQRRKFQCLPFTPSGSTMGLCWPTRRFWVPFVRRSFSSGLDHPLTTSGQLLVDAAEATGGALHKASGLTEPTLTSTFKQAFDDFRRAYVLRYTPANVTREGWHAIQVRVPNHNSFVVHARSGYAIEAPPTKAPANPSLVPSSTPKTLDDLTAAYDSLQFEAVAKGLREITDPVKLIRDFRTTGNPWPATPRREAAFALELAETGLFAHRDDARTAAKDLVAAFATLLRNPIEPDGFERRWWWAAVSIAEGTIHPSVAQPIVTAARARFPDEPRFVLADAIVVDQLWPLRPASAGNGQRSLGAATPLHIAEVTKRYEAAAALNDTAGEANVRFGWFLHRLGREEDALARLDAAMSSPLDQQMQYLRLLFRGHVLSALNRLDDAIVAYREALAIMPDTPSANVALMNARLLVDDKTAAEALAEHVQTARATTDPWWMYWQGDYRFYPTAIAALRQMSR
jgi:VWFA-related protein